MKILLTTVYDYPHAGGLSTHVTTLKAGLEAQGHTVDVLSFSDVPFLKQMFLAQGPSNIVNRIKKGRGIMLGLYARQLLLQKLIEKHKKRGYDIINAQDPYATLASIPSGIPTVSTAHGYLSYEAVSKGSVKANSEEAKLLQNKEIISFQKTRRVITVDQRIKQYVSDVAGIEGTAIRNFIDVEGFKPDVENRSLYKEKHQVDNEKKVLFVPRRLTKKNGVIYPALAMKKILTRYPETILIYAGSGEDLPEIERVIKEDGIEKEVKLLGAIPHEKIKEYYSFSDIVLIPSIHSAGVEEATSISALEAMGSGSPVIACAVGGLKEIINDGVDGILVEEQNVEALADAVIRLFDHPELASEYALKARTKIEAEYSHIAAAKKYAEIYEDVVGKK